MVILNVGKTVAKAIWKYRGPILTGVGIVVTDIGAYMAGMRHNDLKSAHEEYKAARDANKAARDAKETATGEEYTKKDYNRDQFNTTAYFLGKVAKIEAAPVAVWGSGVTMGAFGIANAVKSIKLIDAQTAIIAQQASKLKTAGDIANLAGSGIIAGTAMQKPDEELKSVSVDEDGTTTEIEGVDNLFDDSNRFVFDIPLNATPQLAAETAGGDVFQGKLYIMRGQSAVQTSVNNGYVWTYLRVLQDLFGLKIESLPEELRSKFEAVMPILLTNGWKPGDKVDFGAFKYTIQTPNGLAMITDEDDLMSDSYEVILRMTDDGYVRFAFNGSFLGDVAETDAPVNLVSDSKEIGIGIDGVVDVD